ncbi:MAG TPA: hypothetical protein VLN61_00885 [Pseudolabrys sp.]|nr:hypothetical protein [Pseudolabrys sp.]
MTLGNMCANGVRKLSVCGSLAILIVIAMTYPTQALLNASITSLKLATAFRSRLRSANTIVRVEANSKKDRLAAVSPKSDQVFLSGGKLITGSAAPH